MSEHLPIAYSLASLLRRPIGAADRARARLHLLDYLACAIAGVTEPGCAEVRRLAAREGGGPCRIIGGGMAGPQSAALANGPIGAILEMDDVDKLALLHPGPVVMPAALAAVQAEGITDGNRLLDGIVAGYEAMIRVGRAAGSHYRMFHATATCGTFGAAAAAARVFACDAEQTAWALGNAGQQAAGLWQVRHEPVFTKSLHDGRAAANGMAAAFLALDGYRGPVNIFEGPQGFFAAMCGDADPKMILTDANAGWRLHEVSFKPHAACRHAHAAIDAALRLRPSVAGRAIARMDVRTYGDALLFCRHDMPVSPGEAKFSLTHAVAVALVMGDAGLDRFTINTINDPLVARMRDLVGYEEDPAISARFPAHFGAAIRVVLEDGSILEAHVEDALGDPENPLDYEGIVAKARKLLAWGGMTKVASDALIETALSLGDCADLDGLMAKLPGASE